MVLALPLHHHDRTKGHRFFHKVDYALLLCNPNVEDGTPLPLTDDTSWGLRGGVGDDGSADDRSGVGTAGSAA